MVIDWTISVGNLLQIAVFLVVGIGAFFALRTDIKILHNQVRIINDRQDDLATTTTNISNTLTTVAVQGERINQMSKTIDEMRHGQGFVNPMRS